MANRTNPFGPGGWTPVNIKTLLGKTYVVTGANAGAGFEATRVFLSKGAKVIMLNRSRNRSDAAITKLKQEFPKAEVSFIIMDLAVLDSVRNAAQAVLEQVPDISALICNAAIAQVATQQLTVDGFESQLGVNHFGHFLLCGLLFRRVEVCKGRIVVVGSNGYKMGLKCIQFDDMNFDKKYSAMNAYCQSKLAQMMFAYELQRRLGAAGSNVQVQVCHPGAARTELSKDEASWFTKLLFKLLSPFAQSAKKGSWPEVMCATEDDLKSESLYGPTRRMEMVGAIGECPLKPHVLDREAAAKLWSLSEEKTGHHWNISS